MKQPEIKQLVAIAKKHRLIQEGREDLNAKNSDSLDFTNCAVWNIAAALVEAYALGRAGKDNHPGRSIPPAKPSPAGGRWHTARCDG